MNKNNFSSDGNKLILVLAVAIVVVIICLYFRNNKRKAFIEQRIKKLKSFIVSMNYLKIKLDKKVSWCFKTVVLIFLAITILSYALVCIVSGINFSLLEYATLIGKVGGVLSLITLITSDAYLPIKDMFEKMKNMIEVAIYKKSGHSNLKVTIVKYEAELNDLEKELRKF